MSADVKLRYLIKTSFHKRSNYEVSVPLDINKALLSNFANSLDSNDNDDLRRKVETKDFFSLIVPSFQRDNDKWSLEMKQRFVENLLLGVKSTILLYYVPKEKLYGVYVDCRLLDGYQRLTALNEWMDGLFPIFEDIYYSEEIKSIVKSCNNLTVRIYTLDTEEEVVKFYIQLNENISHSKEDINKAKRYLESLQTGDKL